jgi:hypothetical protein
MQEGLHDRRVPLNLALIFLTSSIELMTKASDAIGMALALRVARINWTKALSVACQAGLDRGMK